MPATPAIPSDWSERADSSYQKVGFAVLPGILPPAEVDTLLDHLTFLQSRLGGEGSLVTAALESDPVLGAIAEDPRMTGIAATLIGADPACFGVTYVVKRPYTGLAALWHQDGYAWSQSLGISEAVTLWIALDPADSGNGCLRVIPASHTRVALPLRRNSEVASIFGWEMDPGLLDETAAVDLMMAPGDVSAHHSSLIHGSGPNLSPRWRRALVLRYARRPPTATPRWPS